MGKPKKDGTPAAKPRVNYEVSGVENVGDAPARARKSPLPFDQCKKHGDSFIIIGRTTGAASLCKTQNEKRDDGLKFVWRLRTAEDEMETGGEAGCRIYLVNSED